MRLKEMVSILSLAMMLTLSGCAVLVAGGVAAGGAVVYLNKVESTVQSPVPAAHEAARESLVDFGLDVVEDAHDMETGRLKSKFADGKYVWVSLESAGPAATAITVRVGIVGETERAQKIMNAIKSHLPQGGGDVVAESSD